MRKFMSAAFVILMLLLVSCQPQANTALVDETRKLNDFAEDFSIEELLSDVSDELVSLEIDVKEISSEEYNAVISFDRYAIGDYSRIDSGSLSISFRTDEYGNAFSYSISTAAPVSVSYSKDGNIVTGNESWTVSGVTILTVEEGSISGVKISGDKITVDESALSAIFSEGLIIRGGSFATANRVKVFPDWMHGDYLGTFTAAGSSEASMPIAFSISDEQIAVSYQEDEDSPLMSAVIGKGGYELSEPAVGSSASNKQFAFQTVYDSYPALTFVFSEGESGALDVSISIPDAGSVNGKFIPVNK